MEVTQEQVDPQQATEEAIPVEEMDPNDPQEEPLVEVTLRWLRVSLIETRALTLGGFMYFLQGYSHGRV